VTEDGARWQAVVNTVKKLWVPSNEGNFLTNLRTGRFSKRTLLPVVSPTQLWHWIGLGGWKMYRVLLGKPEGKTPLGRPGCGWEDNMKLDLEGIDKEGVDWFLLLQDGGPWQAVVSMAMNVWWYKVKVMDLVTNQEGLCCMDFIVFV
jgi:hypothetical protein